MLTPSDFVLLAPDLIPAALRYVAVLEGRGYSVKPEPNDVSFPFTPTLEASRRGTTLIVEVASTLNDERAEEWARFGRSCSDETRILMLIASSRMPGVRRVTRLSDLGVGIELINVVGIQSLASPRDLAIRVELPALSRTLAPMLGRAYELFGQGNWLECFEEACIAFEHEAKAYLIRSMNGRGVSFATSSGRKKQYTVEEVESKTLGQTARVFAEIAAPTQVDHRVAQSLERVNKERVTAAHFRDRDPARQRELRDQVGRHLNVIVNAIRHIYGEA